MDIQEYIRRSKLKYKYASQDGFILGLYFGLFYMLSVFFPSSITNTLNLLSNIATPFICYYFAKQFRDNVWDGGIRYHQALGFGIYLFFFASLIMSVFFYIDLKFIHTDMVNNILNTYIPLFEKLNSSKDQIQDQINLLYSFSAIDWTLYLIFSYLFSGFILFLILSFILVFTGKKTKKIRITINQDTKKEDETQNNDNKKA